MKLLILILFITLTGFISPSECKTDIITKIGKKELYYQGVIYKHYKTKNHGWFWGAYYYHYQLKDSVCINN